MGSNQTGVETCNVDQNALAVYNEFMNGNEVNVHHVRNHKVMQYRRHQHNFYELLFIMSGSVVYEVEGRSYNLRGGDIMIINRLEFHQCRVSGDKPYERYVLWLHPDVVETWGRMDLQIDLLDCFHQCSENHYNLLRLDSESFGVFIKNLGRLADTEQNAAADAHARALHKIVALEILILINKCYQNPLSLSAGLSKFPDPRMNELLGYINQNLGADLSLDTLAARFKMSKFYLGRIFKQYAGQSLHQFVLSKRLLQARYLIDNGMPPSRASLETGFIDYSNFARTFKRCYGVSPRQAGSRGNAPPQLE